jgi:hypothetical protein
MMDKPRIMGVIGMGLKTTHLQLLLKYHDLMRNLNLQLAEDAIPDDLKKKYKTKARKHDIAGLKCEVELSKLQKPPDIVESIMHKYNVRRAEAVIILRESMKNMKVTVNGAPLKISHTSEPHTKLWQERCKKAKEGKGYPPQPPKVDENKWA